MRSSSVWDVMRKPARKRRLFPATPRRKHFMARERRLAAYRVEIERAVDEVKHTRSKEWFRAMMHQHAVQHAGAGGGPRVTDDDGRVLRPRGRSASMSSDRGDMDSDTDLDSTDASRVASSAAGRTAAGPVP